ncbi:hypothetical protein [Alkalicoccobacillus gibsonii]|jgi:hypothetical protein|uniref:Uncharacterized protein n=1 Tax=Alkalicoccobacillus gibsonii TaxID=79881 RepID=A0ABU9VD24_9BACI|nr:hypothetical protein [Alkalicoccobacillus gibsonii]MBM0066317.1 hypothetical protein [Alkalicoccobacillus gibsonii]
MRKIILGIFILSVILFTVLGTVLVFGQMLGLFTFQANWVIGLNENLASTVYFMTSIAAFSGYLLSYFKQPKVEEEGK